MNRSSIGILSIRRVLRLYVASATEAAWAAGVSDVSAGQRKKEVCGTLAACRLLYCYWLFSQGCTTARTDHDLAGPQIICSSSRIYRYDAVLDILSVEYGSNRLLYCYWLFSQGCTTARTDHDLADPQIICSLSRIYRYDAVLDILSVEYGSNPGNTC